MAKYPATVADIVFALKLPEARLQRTLRGLQARGFIALEPLEGKTYVRLVRADYSFVGRQVTQRRRVKRHGRKDQEPKDYEGPMFG